MLAGFMRAINARWDRDRGRSHVHAHAAHATHAARHAAAGRSSFGASATMASVVSISEATEAAFCSAVRVTLVGSRMPISIMSP